MSEGIQQASRSSVTPPLPPGPKFSLKRFVSILFITLGSFGFLALLGCGGYFYYLFHQAEVRKESANRKIREKEQAQLQLQKALAQKVEDIRLNGDRKSTRLNS